jgi:hypothetical protein
MTSITMESMIKKRLAESNKGEDTFMHVCAIIPCRTLFDIKQYPKCNYWDELVT